MENEPLDKGEEPTTGYVRIPMPILEITAGLMFLAALIWYILGAQKLPRPFNEADIGAGGFPLLIATGTVAATVLMIAHGVAGITGKIEPSMTRWRRPLYVLLAIVILSGQALLFETLGVYACVALFSAAVMLAAGERRPLRLLGVPIALMAFIYVVFALALNVLFP